MPNSKNINSAENAETSLNKLSSEQKLESLANTGKLLEMDVPFDPNQDSTVDIGKVRSRIYIVALIIFLIASVIFILSYRSPTIEEVEILPTSDTYQGVIYLPDEQTLSNNFSGKIISNGLADMEEYKFKLLDRNNQAVAYLYAEQNDLSLSQGYMVEIYGDIRGKYNGLDVIHVKSVKLK